MRDYIHVNLLPIEYRVVRKDYSWLLDWRVVVPVIVLLAEAAGYAVGSIVLQENLDQKNISLSKVEREIEKNAYVLKQIRERENLRDEMNAKNRSLRGISVSKKRWVTILEGLNQSLPLNMWIESIRQNEADENKMEIRGRTFVFPEVAEFMLELESREFFETVELSSIELEEDKSRKKEKGKEKEDTNSFLFTVRIHINPNYGIDKLVVEPNEEELSS